MVPAHPFSSFTSAALIAQEQRKIEDMKIKREEVAWETWKVENGRQDHSVNLAVWYDWIKWCIHTFCWQGTSTSPNEGICKASRIQECTTIEISFENQMAISKSETPFWQMMADILGKMHVIPCSTTLRNLFRDAKLNPSIKKPGWKGSSWSQVKENRTTGQSHQSDQGEDWWGFSWPGGPGGGELQFQVPLGVCYGPVGDLDGLDPRIATHQPLRQHFQVILGFFIKPIKKTTKLDRTIGGGFKHLCSTMFNPIWDDQRPKETVSVERSTHQAVMAKISDASVSEARHSCSYWYHAGTGMKLWVVYGWKKSGSFSHFGSRSRTSRLAC